jgi:hypothetical protein
VFSPDQLSDVEGLSRQDFDGLVGLAHSNHVIMRALPVFLNAMRSVGDEERAEWAHTALLMERARIDQALTFLESICDTLRASGLNVMVIKSLDHLPDIGSDLDLYTDAEPAAVTRILHSRFRAKVAEQSWGDRLACKFNYLIPDLPEAVEIHMGRLGQTGEQITIASRLLERSRTIDVAGHSFRVTHTSDRLLISTLQRMYRHFYFRLCDILDTTELAEVGGIDFADLHQAAEAAGIWQGVATYLKIVSDYVQRYRGTGLALPSFVLDSARFGGEEVFYRRAFLRVPILPQSAKLYGSQLTGLLRRRQIVSTARLSLLPWLATAALVGEKITGSDKGIW